MVFRQIRKCCHIIMDTAHSVKGNGMGRYFHHNIFTPGSFHCVEKTLQFETFRSSSLCGNHLLADQVFHGADQTHLGSLHRFQHMLQKQGGRGLTVGTGDADHCHRFGRMSIEIAAEHRQGHPVGFHQHIGNRNLGLLCRNHHRCALFHGHGDKAVAVGGKAGDGHKQAAGGYFSGIVADRIDLHFQIRMDFLNSNILEQFFQFHNDSFCA